MPSPTTAIPAAPRPGLTPGLIAILALLCAVTPMSVDMYLPALPRLAVAYQVTPGEVQLTLSAFMIAFGFGQIAYGPLGDHFGRRPVLLGGLVVYVATSILCALAQTIEQLIVLRFLQGLAACAAPSMARTMVRDLADRERAASALSMIMAGVSVAPMLAPFVGATILDFAGWHAIFGALAAFGVVACLTAWFGTGETLKPELRGPLAFGQVLQRFGELLRTRLFVGYALCTACLFGAMFAFISGAPFVFIDIYGLSPHVFSYCFAANVVSITLGASLNSRLVRRVGVDALLRRAVWLPAVVACCLLALALVEHFTGALGIWPFLPFFVVLIGSLSLIAPNATAGALHNYPHMAGTASSLIGVIQYGLGALFGAVVGQLLGGSILPMIAVIAAGGVGCFLAHSLLVRR
jgi:DHA1 family bicyclomycin/chloramphenicol resistance-like MFS transporter